MERVTVVWLGVGDAGDSLHLGDANDDEIRVL